MENLQYNFEFEHVVFLKKYNLYKQFFSLFFEAHFYFLFFLSYLLYTSTFYVVFQRILIYIYLIFFYIIISLLYIICYIKKIPLNFNYRKEKFIYFLSIILIFVSGVELFYCFRCFSLLHLIIIILKFFKKKKNKKDENL